MSDRSGKLRNALAAGGAALALGVATLPCDARADAEWPYLLGDVRGARQALAERGIGFEIAATVDLVGVVGGGIDPGFESPASFDLTLTLDTGAAGLWQNGSVLVYWIGNTGGDPSLRAGDLQRSSNIETTNTFKLFEASYEHGFFDDSLALLVGLHDLSSDFYASEYGGLFLNSSFRTGIDTSQVGISSFSTTSLGARLRWNPSEPFYLLGAVYDGVPGDPREPKGTQVVFGKDDGVFAIGEVGLAGGEEEYYKLGIGGWYHSAEFRDVAGVLRDENAGLYTLAEAQLWSDGAARKVGVFAQAGFADSKRSRTGIHLGGGISAAGLIPGRGDDVLGLAVAHARNGYAFHRANPGRPRAETAIELTYLLVPLPWLTLQPNLQYILNPGTVGSRDDALVVGTRLQLSF